MCERQLPLAPSCNYISLVCGYHANVGERTTIKCVVVVIESERVGHWHW